MHRVGGVGALAGSATQASTSRMDPSPSAAACSSAASARRAWLAQKSRSLRCPGALSPASRSAARAAAVDGSWQPDSGSSCCRRR